MTMAADQRKRRLNGTSVVGCSSREQYRAKKKSLGLAQYDLNMSPHISLEWDGSQKRVVAKREQICITRRDMTRFIDFVPNSQNILADVFAIPREMFELENLAEVLSCEVWHTHLSEKERNFLVQFLPKGADAQQVVQALLAGDNFQFGNPFLKWGASLCSGDLHPDVVLHHEQCFKANKRAYYSELQKYHNDMIGNLQKLKERWASCKDPEKEQNIWRSRKQTEKNISALENDSRFRNLEENLGATSESCSWVADEKACSSDNQYSSMMKAGEVQKRQGFVRDKCQNPLAASNGVLKVVGGPKKGEKLKKRNIHCSDGAKYMSYFKISKKQHQLVKSMKQSGKSILSRSLNRVLGDLDSFHVQPYEVFEEEERKKLHEHCDFVPLKLSFIYIGCKWQIEIFLQQFANWRKRQSERWKMTKSLEQEIEEKLKSVMEDQEKENSDSVLQEQKSGGTDHESTTEDDEESVPETAQNQPLQQIHSLNGSHEVNPMEMDSEDSHVISKPDVAPPDISEYSGNLNPTDVAVRHGVHPSSAGDVWPSVSMPQSFYHSTSSREYASASELSLGHPQVIEEHQTHMIDLESDIREEDAEENLLHRQCQ
ncbi:hypothetical protein L1049_002904 [Liquidambar formosana]|uniref:DEUBAD domain-containing protein n=1 Tax=Liquidambar formosana TaxID=63359 RepID=A0AAP0NI34_LIQFO